MAKPLANNQQPEIDELLRRRAERVRRALAAPEEEALFMAAEFPVGEEMYALPLESLRAAVPLRMVTPIPLSQPHVLGVLRFQGEIITALSLASLLGGRGWREDPAVLLVVETGFAARTGQSRLVALDCERIPKSSGYPRALVDSARARSSGEVTELTLPDLRQVNLLDLGKLLRRHQGPSRDAL